LLTPRPNPNQEGKQGSSPLLPMSSQPPIDEAEFGLVES
jgi:hypothetical protein